MRVAVSERSMDSISSEKLAASVSENDSPQTSDGSWETFGLMAPIVNFTADGPKPDNEPYPKLNQLLRDGPSKILSDRSSSYSMPSERPLFRWIHVPVNKMD